MLKQKETKIITSAYTTSDLDIGCRLICNSASNFTITLHSPTGRNNFDLEIDNIGTGVVSCNGLLIKQNSHAHLGCTGTAWILAVSDLEMTKAEIESVLTGQIDSHSHAAVYELPVGGTAGQVLAKVDGTDRNVEWVDMTAPPAPTTEACTVTVTTSDAASVVGQVITMTDETAGANTETYTLLTGESSHIFNVLDAHDYHISVDAKSGYTTPDQSATFTAVAGDTRSVIMNYVAEAAEYTDNMIKFFSIPGASGKIRLKVEKPSSATGVMLRWKATAWASGDTEATGTLIATITDDGNYKDANEWYEATGLTNGTAYYIKAFPYNSSTVYNVVIGSNETLCRAGLLTFEMTMDSISGTTVNDTSGGGNNGTSSNLTVSAGTIGNKGVFNGSSSKIDLSTPFSDATVRSITGIIKFPAAGAGVSWIVALGSAGIWLAILKADTELFVSMYQSSGATSRRKKFTYSDVAGLTVHMVMNTCGVSGNPTDIAFYKNTVALTAVGTDNTGTVVTPATSSQIGAHGDSNYANCEIDQLRFFSSNLTTGEIASLYNGGAGC